MAKLVIINGKPATGKTTLKAQLKQRLSIPMLGKDELKEFIFDTVGVGDREWSRQIGRATADMLYDFTATLLAEGQDVLIENAFWVEFAKPRYQTLLELTSSIALELYCDAPEVVRQTRNDDRLQKGTRHPGYVDELLEIHDEVDNARYAPLALGEVITIDTTNLDEAGYEALAQRVKDFLATANA